VEKLNEQVLEESEIAKICNVLECLVQFGMMEKAVELFKSTEE
jgi:pentatricopeptide repeat protein